MKKNNHIRVLVAMSGGVDSSVAAALLKSQGYQVDGVFLHFWKDKSVGGAGENRCCSLEALLDAKAVAAQIGIPLYTFDFSAPFKKAVVDNFLKEYETGRTPNPCVVCNKKIKIGRLLKQALVLGYDYVATGHYLKIKKVGREYRLFKAQDRKKDQSYFLYTFNQAELRHLMFPLGGYQKDKTRRLAVKYKLRVAAKPESQDICFLSGDHNNFLRAHLKLKAGEIRLLGSEEVIGEHGGLSLYTIGQRRGLVGGRGPYYVAEFNYKKNILYVVKNWNEAVLYQSRLLATNVNWLTPVAPKRTLKCTAVIRYGHPAVACRAIPFKKSDYIVEFLEPQRAVTPGQSVVFYQDDRVLGGGLITVL